MSLSHDFDSMRNAVNRIFGDFDLGLRGRRGGVGGFGGGGGYGLGGGVSPWELGAGLGGWGGWDTDLYDLPLLTSGLVQGPSAGRESLKGSTDETKMEDVVGGGQQLSGQQLVPGGGGGQLQAGHQTSTFRPDQVMRARVNIEEQDDKFVVTAEMPGFDKEKIKLNVTDNILHIKGEQTKEFIDEAKDKRYLRTERTFANIERRLRVPKGTDLSKISAEYKHGILHVNLPKSPESEVKKQEIQIG